MVYQEVISAEQPKYKARLNVLCLTLLILDSGGGLRIRYLAFLIIMAFASYGLYQYRTLNKNFVILYSIFLLSIMPGLIISITNGVAIPEILTWIVAFLLIPFFYFYVKGSGLSHQSFISAGVIFSCFVIALFFGRLMNIGIVNTINDYINSHSDGFFGNKNFLNGDILPNVYFQGTLSVIICGGLSLRRKSYLSFFIILTGLIIAPSRFGFIVLVLWASFLFFKKSMSRLILLPVIIVIAFVILQNLAFGKELFSVFNGDSDALDVRNGHISSIFNIFVANPMSFLFGQGPGSVFYTSGTDTYTTNIEISQLEFVRKYGIISFLLFCLFYFFPLFSRVRADLYSKGALVLYFIVSFSNPVLFSIFAMLYLSFVYVELFDHTNNHHVIIKTT